MRFSLVLLLVVGVAVVAGVVPNSAHEQDDVRGAFLTSRPKEKPQSTPAATKRTDRKPVRPSPTPNPVKTGPTTGTPVTSKKNPPATVSRARIGMGITLFMRDSNGNAVRADPARVFNQGDRVRVLLETNTDGYLYIFNTTNDGPPVMIYPQIELDGAGNYIQAHVPIEIPDGLAESERLRWFTFDENAGDEKLYFVFSKQPIPGVPIGDDLIAFCKQNSCPVRPPTELWAKVQVDLKLPLKTDRKTQVGATQTVVEAQATTRGIGLAQTDPEPSMILMASSNTSILVTSLDLIHK